MISVVIRNKNEGQALLRMLPILTSLYSKYISDIILVDNRSEDNSVLVAKSYGCRIVFIDDFTYGKAINLGIDRAKNQYVLLLSSHALPIGLSFFKTAIDTLTTNSKIAGIRFINSFDNYVKAHDSDYTVTDPLQFGLMAACALVNKDIWEYHKFDEALEASEDKEWSQRVVKHGYIVKAVPETFIYFAKRNTVQSLKRWEIETLAYHRLQNVDFSSYFKITTLFFYNVTFGTVMKMLENINYQYRICMAKFRIKKALKPDKC